MATNDITAIASTSSIGHLGEAATTSDASPPLTMAKFYLHDVMRKQDHACALINVILEQTDTSKGEYYLIDLLQRILEDAKATNLLSDELDRISGVLATH